MTVTFEQCRCLLADARICEQLARVFEDGGFRYDWRDRPMKSGGGPIQAASRRDNKPMLALPAPVTVAA